MYYIKYLIIITPLFTIFASAQESGREIFQNTCVACHAINTKLVGPSIKEIRSIYSQKNIDKMIMWINQPGKKRKDAVMQMPSMSYLGDKKIKQVANYILSIPTSTYNKK